MGTSSCCVEQRIGAITAEKAEFLAVRTSFSVLLCVQIKVGDSKPGFFAIASAPGAHAGSGVLEFLIKGAPGGLAFANAHALTLIHGVDVVYLQLSMTRMHPRLESHGTRLLGPSCTKVKGTT